VFGFHSVLLRLKMCGRLDEYVYYTHYQNICFVCFLHREIDLYSLCGKNFDYHPILAIFHEFILLGLDDLIGYLQHTDPGSFALSLEFELTAFQFSQVKMGSRIGRLADQYLTRTSLRGQPGGDIDVITQGGEI